MTQPVEIRLLHGLDDLSGVDDLFVEVWGAGVPLLGVELMRAIEHSGGYVAAAYSEATMVGASVGFRGDHGGPSLHSHITGVVARARGLGVGQAIKRHQRAWAAEHGLVAITWTFDPLVRRNAWFNLARLGARPVEYLVDFYGRMPDGINAGDESDRLYAVWPVNGGAPAAPHVGGVPVLAEVSGRPVRVAAPGARHVLVATPSDIETMRPADPGLAREWRLAVREVLGGEMASGAVVGFTGDGCYVVERTPS